jgi:hypothetical protein
MKKFQFQLDPVIEESLAEIRGGTKVDKIRWALCVYRVVQGMERGEYRAFAESVTFIVNEAARLYRMKPAPKRK